MKAIYLLALGAVAFTACTGKTATDTAATSTCDKNETYVGVLPAADCEGIRYTLSLDYSDDKNCTDGDYDLTEVHLQADSTAVDGVRDSQTFRTEGDFQVKTGTPSDPSQKYIVLTPDKESDATATPLYFLIDSDKAITLVGADLTKADSPLNYTLTLK